MLGQSQGGPDLRTQLQYFVLPGLQDTIMTKQLWSQFAEIFATKSHASDALRPAGRAWNAIRDSRQVTGVIRNDGEAAIGWFHDIFAAAGDSPTLDNSQPSYFPRINGWVRRRS